MSHSALRRLALRAAAGAGAGIGAGFSLAGKVRPAAKPLHPVGRQFTGTLHMAGLPSGRPDLGIPWLRDRGSAPVLVRLSRSAGLPPPFPDVFGVALRVQHAEGVADLLFSTTGTGRLTRYVLLPRLTLYAPYTTLMPYRTASGPVVVRADIVPPAANVASTASQIPLPLTIRLSLAQPSQHWQAFGTVELTSRAWSEDDPPVSFDAILNRPPGLENYEWARLLREPSYSAARRTRDAGIPPVVPPTAAIPVGKST